MHRLCKIGAHLGLFKCPGTEHTNELHAQFSEHISYFGLSYGTKEEYDFRLGIYADNENIINEHNA